MYLAISLIAPNILLAGMAAMLIFKPIDTNARWAKRHDIKKASMFKKTGLLLGESHGQYLINDDPAHAFVIAPTRSGKGVGLVIPNLLAWTDSFICLDVKGENHRITSGSRAYYGNKVINFCPFSKDKKSHCYNPLDYISDDIDRRITDLQVMASIFITLAERSDPHFPEEAQDLFVGLALYILDEDAFPTTIGSIFRLLGTEDELGDILQHVAKTHPELDEAARQLFNAFANKAEKEKSGIKSTLGRALKLWRNPVIDAVTSKSDFSFHDLRKKKLAIYLGIGVSDMSTLAPLMRIFFEQAISVLTSHEPDPKTEPYKVLLLMDEFHVLGKMQVMANAFTLMAGFNVRLMGVVQNIGLLDKVYDRSTRDTILSNCAHQIFFATNNADTQKYISGACGERAVKSKSISKGRGFSTDAQKVSISEKIVPLIRTHEINTFGDNKAIILVDRHHPVKCKKIIYYKDKAFKPMLRPAAPTPDLVMTKHTAPKFNIPGNDQNGLNKQQPTTSKTYVKRKARNKNKKTKGEHNKKSNNDLPPVKGNDLNKFLK